MILTMMTLLITISLMLLLLPLLTSPNHNSREKSSPFECGFDPKHSARTPFSLHFFLIAIIFLIFDVEIVLLLPLPLTMHLTHQLNLFLLITLFILILLLGTYYEWTKGALSWMF